MSVPECGYLSKKTVQANDYLEDIVIDSRKCHVCMAGNNAQVVE